MEVCKKFTPQRNAGKKFTPQRNAGEKFTPQRNAGKKYLLILLYEVTKMNTCMNTKTPFVRHL